MVHKITLMEAYLMEAIKNAGISKEELMTKVQNRSLDDYNEVLHKSFDFTQLYALADQDVNVLVDILENGYEVKFLTFPGLKRLLEIKLNKQENKDYEVDEFVILKLQLNEEEARIVNTFLSNNWVLEYREDGYIVRPNN